MSDQNRQNTDLEGRVPVGQIQDEFNIPIQREEQPQANIPEEKNQIAQEANSNNLNNGQGDIQNEGAGVASNVQDDILRDRENQQGGGGRGGNFFHDGVGRGGFRGRLFNGSGIRGGMHGGGQDRGGYGRSPPYNRNDQCHMTMLVREVWAVEMNSSRAT